MFYVFPYLFNSRSDLMRELPDFVRRFYLFKPHVGAARRKTETHMRARYQGRPNGMRRVEPGRKA